MKIEWSTLALWLAYSMSYHIYVSHAIVEKKAGSELFLFLKGFVPLILFAGIFLNWQVFLLGLGVNLLLWLLKRATPYLSEPQGFVWFCTFNLVMLFLLFLMNQWFLRPSVAGGIQQVYRHLTEDFGLAPKFLNTMLVHTVGLGWIIWGGTYFVRSLLAPILTPSQKVPAEEFRRGKLIGNLERVLLYLFIQINLYSLITIVVGLKAVARFKQMDEREFAEYFLIGTLASLLIACIIAFFTKALAGIGT